MKQLRTASTIFPKPNIKLQERVVFLHSMTFIMIYIFHYNAVLRFLGFAKLSVNKSNFGITNVTESNIYDGY